MRSFKYIILAGVIFFSSYSVFAEVQTLPAKQKTAIQKPMAQKPAPIKVMPLQIVSNPQNYLNKEITMDAKFDKFSTLGLDYKKAFRDSSKYIGFLIQRDDVKDHNIPLSELKLFLTREYAEKFIDLNTGDKINMTGKVFSNALGDAWIQIDNIKILEKVPDNKEEK